MVLKMGHRDLTNRVNTSYTPVRTEADRASGDPPMSGLQDSPRLDPAGSVEPPCRPQPTQLLVAHGAEGAEGIPHVPAQEVP
jgi:hypothetical protein